MHKVIISDTSCLIILAKIGELDLLRRVYKVVTITQTIFLEFGDELPHWIEIENASDSY